MQIELENDAKIVFVLGKPGCGKGTLCKNLEEKIDIKFFSAGDLLRDEVKRNPESKEWQKIGDDMNHGIIIKP